MNYLYASLYVIMCIVIFILIFMSDHTFDLLFEKKYNNIIDYNDSNFTGGIEYVFNPFRYIMPLHI